MDKGGKRSFNPWVRTPIESRYLMCEDHEYYRENLANKRPKFTCIPQNVDLDIYIKRAAIKASHSVVALVSYSGEVELNQGSGVIIESVGDNHVAMTSANLIRRPTDEDVASNTLADNLKVVVHAHDRHSYASQIQAYDMHYNVLIITFKSSYPLHAAKMRLVDDGVSILHDTQKSVLRPHAVKLIPGDVVIALGRYFYRPFDFMAAPGCLSAERGFSSDFDCKELMEATCSTTRCGDGGPLINQAGEVIGITYYDIGCFSLFLPINIALKWWNHYKINKELRHLSLGFHASNLYVADLSIIERIISDFPSISEGVIVEKVIPGSSAHSAGLRLDDVIIKCGGRDVDSFLELWEIMWDKVGEAVELEVARAGLGTLLSFSVVVAEATELNKWGWRDYR